MAWRFLRPTYWRVRRLARKRLGSTLGALFTRVYFDQEAVLNALSELGDERLNGPSVGRE